MLLSLVDLILELLERHGLGLVVPIPHLLLSIPSTHHRDPSLHDRLDQAEALHNDDHGDDVVEDDEVAENGDDLERAIERLTEKVTCHTNILLELRHLGLLIGQNMIRVWVGILPHRLRVDEEYDESNGHQKVVTAHM